MGASWRAACACVEIQGDCRELSKTCSGVQEGPVGRHGVLLAWSYRKCSHSHHKTWRCNKRLRVRGRNTLGVGLSSKSQQMAWTLLESLQSRRPDFPNSCDANWLLGMVGFQKLSINRNCAPSTGHPSSVHRSRTASPPENVKHVWRSLAQHVAARYNDSIQFGEQHGAV